MRVDRFEVIPVAPPSETMLMDPGEFLCSAVDVFDPPTSLDQRRPANLPSGPVRAVVVRLTTDEGVSGIGTVGTGSGGAVYILTQHLKALVLGQNPFDVELLWRLMFRSTLNYGRKGVALQAISAVDIALWDIIGKVTGQPVYNLLGGCTRERIRVYASRLYARKNLDELAAQAERFVAAGFTAMKQRFGYGPSSGAEGMRKNVELVSTVRSVIGPDIELMADAYMGWDVPYAIRMIRMLEDADLRLEWVEEPVTPDDIDGYAKIRRSVATPISGGEHESTLQGYHELIRRDAVDILQPDVNRAGGITEARKIWALAEANNLRVIPHAGQMHNYHLVISHFNSPIAEYFPPPHPNGVLDDDTLFWELFEGEPKAKAGHVTLPAVPGLGLSLKEEQIQKWIYDTAQ